VTTNGEQHTSVVDSWESKEQHSKNKKEIRRLDEEARQIELELYRAAKLG